MSETPPRKLAVILHADVVGSTTLVQQNDSLAHDRIRAAFQQLSDVTRDYGGIAHEIRGDALVAEFSRPSDAVCAALVFQTSNTERNAKLRDDIRPGIRIGISLGEVIVADGTLTGAGVVLAQRLEHMAEVGGVVIQGSVSETVPTRLPFEFESLGEHSLKGFDQPVRAFSARLGQGAKMPGPDLSMPVSAGKTAEEQPRLELPDKPSVAVLPFTNMSGDPEQEYFSDGITEDIITELSRFRELFVIARNTTFRFKGKDVDVREIARQLGVQYVVEGSVRKSGKRVRITAQLVDALNESEVWADRYDRDLDDVFEVQDEVVASIAGTLPSRVRHAELERADRRPLDLRAYDLAQQAWQLVWTKTGVKTATEPPRGDLQIDPKYSSAQEVLKTATEHAQRALQIDPKYGSAHACLVGIQLLNWRNRWSGTPEETLELALKHGRLAVELDETEHAGHWFLSEVYLFRMKDLEQARVHAERAVKLCPNASGPTAWMGFIQGCSGEHQSGIEFCTRALRHDPLAPDYLNYLLGCVNFNARNYEEAIKSFHATEWFSKPELLSVTYAKAGRVDEAREILAFHSESIAPEMTQLPDSWFAYFAERCPYVREDDVAHYLSGLEAAIDAN